MTDKLGQVLYYASRGWPVFPVYGAADGACLCSRGAQCGSPAKHPLASLVPNGLKDATTNPATIRGWHEAAPGANWGLVTGQVSELVVLDVDPGKGGLLSLDDLKAEHGWMVETPTVKTGSGGLHLYLRHPGEQVKNSASRLGPGLDIRGDGGYVVVPPSVHASGGEYAWQIGPEDTELEPVPAWMLGLLHLAMVPKAPPQLGGETVTEGGRNVWLTQLAGTLRRRGMAPEAVLGALLSANQSQCTPPLPEDEVRKIAESSSRWEAGVPLPATTPGPQPGGDVSAERAVVATVLLQPELLKYVRDLAPVMFTDPEARLAWGRMAEAEEAGRHVLAADFASLADAHAAVSSRWELEELATRVHEAHVLRMAGDLGHQLLVAVKDQDLAAVRSLLKQADLPSRAVDGLTLAEAASQLWDQLETPNQDVLPVGLRALDRVGAIRRGELTILAARPSMGKSQLVFTMAGNVSRGGGVVLVASLEMPAPQVAARIVAARFGVSYRDPASQARSIVSQAVVDLMTGSERLTIVAKPITSQELINTARRVADRHGRLDLVVTDHLNKFRDQHDSQVTRLGTIASNHKALANELMLPVVAVHQLNRNTEHREDKRPTLADLRESGRIEEEADVVAFLYREGYYQARKDGRDDQAGEALVYADKNRNGALYALKLWFDPERGGRFGDLSMEHGGVA